MIIGIDLGTTNSLVACWQDRQARLIPNSHGQVVTPSVVGLGDDGEIMVGEPALGRLITHPLLTTAAFKRYMGTDHEITLGKKIFRMEELSALVLKSLKTDAEAFLGQPIDEAIITVPAYFNDTQRKATRIAGELAGLKVERLLNEPTAAALAYGLHQSDSESCFLVFDLGGGTFDVSVLELFDGIMEVHASAGDNFLGGEDFLNSIVKYFTEKTALSDLTTAQELTPEEVNRLRNEAEKTKIALTDGTETTMHFDFRGKELECAITRDDFGQMNDQLMQRIRRPVERSLRDAKIVTDDIDEIVLVGGAVRMPAIQALVTRMFRRFPVRAINPEEVVAMGAAVQAGLKARNEELKDVVITDVCPYTLGIETV
ncbi:MAG: molecular chaperone HscC, partial [Desulfobacteraceae bacterium]